VIPTDDGDMEVGKRMYNWVWYVNASEGSKELHDIMTDVNGQLHQGTVPCGLLRSEVWDEQRAKSISQMPPCIAHLLQKTEKPFVSKIYDITSSKGVFHDGKVFLVGDALATFRPHIGMNTNQAAYHCALLRQVLEKKMSHEAWQKTVLRYAKVKSQLSIVIGVFGTGSRFALVMSILRYVLILIGLY
jgi:2-polyprenyl-6-methoxyphenol hydroxylase-like FAD-dependent oxidoreductase